MGAMVDMSLDLSTPFPANPDANAIEVVKHNSR